jgi:hypothetical protein
MSRELDSVVLRGKPSLRSRILSWFYPNRGWKGDSCEAEAAEGAKPATKLGADAAQSSSPRRKELTHAV